MPKFSITTVENGYKQDVFENVEFPDEKTATDDAQRALADMATEHLPDGKRDAFAVLVNDEHGEPIYRASLNFEAENAEDIRAAELQAEQDLDTIAKALAGKA